MMRHESWPASIVGHPDHEVRRIPLGRAAIQLGFLEAPEAVTRSLDVDAIIPVSQMDAFAEDRGAWDTQEAAKAELEPSGLYITRFFPTYMMILRADWLGPWVALHRPPTRHLRLYRPATLDPLLTKMMRGLDPPDLEDAAFLCRDGGVSRSDLERSFTGAVIPDVAVIRESLEVARPLVLELARS